MPLITVNLRLVSPYGEEDIPKPASGRVEFIPAMYGTLDGSLRTIEKVISPVINGEMVPVELAPGPWKVKIQPARKHDWPEMVFQLEEGMPEPVNLADLVPEFVFEGEKLAKGDRGPGIVGSRMVDDSTIVFIYENGEESDPVTMPVGRTPSITWAGTTIVVDGVSGPNLRGPVGPAGPAPTTSWTGDKLTVGGQTGPSLTGPSGSSPVRTGIGRPDIPLGTGGVITGNEPIGALYASTDGAGVGAWTWQKIGANTWVVIYGDTGRRQLTPTRTSVTTGFVYFQRTASSVFVAMGGGPYDTWTLASLGSRTEILSKNNVPPGFRPTPKATIPLWNDNGGPPPGMVLVTGSTDDNLIQARGTSSSTPLTFAGTGNHYTTTDTWPTTLPGS